MYRIILILMVIISVGCRTTDKKQDVQTTAMMMPTALADTTGKVVRTEEEWKSILTPQQYHVLREKGTDRPHTGEYTYTKDKGTYSCAACGYELFTSDMKFASECGWPSFDRELAGDRIKTQEDISYGMVRTEILCGRCGSHLGHLFDDGPTLTGKRYCVNSTSLNFIAEKK